VTDKAQKPPGKSGGSDSIGFGRTGLARSRERAQALVLAGVVRIDGRPAGKGE